MKLLLLTLTLSTLLLAKNHTLLTFSADFNQSIQDEHNKTITYLGHMQSKRPNLARWHYEKPVLKTLYVYEDVVTVIEPDLEQAIIKRLDKNIDIFKIMHSAKKIGNNSFEANYNGQRFLLTYKKELLSTITYSDELDNTVTIKFSNQKNNIDLNDTIFKAIIPEDFDVIR
ncbi:MAG: LolA-like outer membrane lipoprotein chaperone [Campylobacterota bacterium]|nr:LolA-like outer membrane lipoprotein chaperone [Campylobacterota bacterium]